MVLNLSPEQVAYYHTHANFDMGVSILAAGICAVAMSVVSVSARMLSRHRSSAPFGWDDWLILVAAMAVIGHFIAMCFAVANGGGRHIIFVKDMKKYILGHVGKMVCYAVGTALVKLSILLFYRRVFPQRPIFVASCVIGAIVILYNTALVLVVAFQCIPLSSIWTVRPGRCIDKSKPTTALAAINLFTDVAVFAIPIKPVLRLKMNRTLKFQVLAAFLLGGIVCIFGAIRTRVLASMHPGDAGQGDIFPGIWSISEMSIGVVAACLPTLGPLFRRSKSFRTPAIRHNSSTSPEYNPEVSLELRSTS